MTREEAGKLLVIIANFAPNYKPSKEAAESWQKVLGTMAFAAAEKYMYEHFRESRFIPMPMDILIRARAEFNPDAIVPMDPPDDMRGAAPDAERLRNRD